MHCSTPSLPTPDTSHLRDIFAKGQVYEPAEDTFALIDALEGDALLLKERQPRLCLEIGSGSGCVSTFLAQLLGSSEALYIASDINPLAASATCSTAKRNGCAVDAILTSLGDALFPRIRGLIDVLVFNPPYVPTSEEEQLNATAEASIAGAWAGGEAGMAITNRLLPQVEHLLSPDGVFYLVAIAENKPEEIKTRIQRDHGLLTTTVLKRRAGREHLHILRIERDRSAVFSHQEQTVGTT